MYNFIIPCSPSHGIVPKYCHVGASLPFVSSQPRPGTTGLTNGKKSDEEANNNNNNEDIATS